MADSIISAFTPSLMSPENLEKIFVDREPLARDLLDNIILSATTPAKHYNLLIGARGMGKTHLVALIYHRLQEKIKEDPSLGEKIAIAWLREEEWGVDSWLDLVFRILRALGEKETHARKLGENLQQLPLKEAQALATHYLMDALQGRTLLLMMENLDDLFQGLGEQGQQEFRSLLQQKQCCTILATTPAIFSSIEERSAPFFGSFAPIYLQGLDVPAAVEMLRKIATLSGQEDLARFLLTPEGRARVRAVHHLAGGNARVYVLFSQFITRDSLDSLVGAFMKMLDDLTPYYQSRMLQLSNQQRKIIEFLVDRRHPVVVKDIATGCFIDPNTAGGQLRNLRNLGYVEPLQEGRESGYELKEVLMRFCLEVKKQRGKWVEIIVDFLRIWVAPEERKERLELMRGKSRLFKDEDLERALLSDEDPVFDGCKKDFLRSLEAQKLPQVMEVLEEMHHTRRITPEKYQQLKELIARQAYIEAKELFDRTVDLALSSTTDSISQLFKQLTGIQALENQNYLEALQVFNDIPIKDISNPDIYNLLGIALGKMGEYEKSIFSFCKAIELKPDKYEAWNNRGISISYLGKYEEAISSFDEALKFKPNYHQAWVNRGVALDNLGKYEEAIASYDKAIYFNLDNPEAWHNKGCAYAHLCRYAESIDCYDRAIEIKLDSYESWHNKGLIKFITGDYSAALSDWETTFDFIPQTSNRHYDVAELIQEFIGELTSRFTLPGVRDFLQQLVPIYIRASVLTELSTALVRTLPKIVDESISDKIADDWLGEWQNLLGDKPQMEIALRLMKVAIEYKKTPKRQKRLWMQLAKEERAILDEALGRDSG